MVWTQNIISYFVNEGNMNVHFATAFWMNIETKICAYDEQWASSTENHLKIFALVLRSWNGWMRWKRPKEWRSGKAATTNTKNVDRKWEKWASFHFCLSHNNFNSDVASCNVLLSFYHSNFKPYETDIILFIKHIYIRRCWIVDYGLWTDSYTYIE